MRDTESFYIIKSILDKLEKEGVESLYQSIRKWKTSNGSSYYSALINDLVACCPYAEQWKNPKVRDSFKQDIKYYCDHYLNLIVENK